MRPLRFLCFSYITPYISLIISHLFLYFQHASFNCVNCFSKFLIFIALILSWLNFNLSISNSFFLTTFDKSFALIYALRLMPLLFLLALIEFFDNNLLIKCRSKKNFLLQTCVISKSPWNHTLRWIF